MQPVAERQEGLTKGERTTVRILDCAEDLFGRQGYGATTLRQIAAAAGIREPGLYNHFDGKQALYGAVLDRALAPMAHAMEAQMAAGVAGYAQLPAVMTDLLLEHPAMASLFQQALRGEADSPGNRLLRDWLERLFTLGVQTMREVGYEEVDPADMAIQVIALFNLTTGYFLAQRAFESMAKGSIADPDNIARQKKLLARIQRALII